MSLLQAQSDSAGEIILKRHRSTFLTLPRSRTARLVMLGTPIAIAVAIPFIGLVSIEVAAITLAIMFGWTVVVGACGCAHIGALNTVACNPTPRSPWLAVITAYLVSGVLAGSVVGWIVGSIGTLVPSAKHAWLLPALVGAGCLIREFFFGNARIPEIRRQTRAKWFHSLPLPFNAAMWGADVGLTFATWITFSGAWLLAAIALIHASPAFGAALFASYWVGRILPHLIEPYLIRDQSGVVPFIGFVVRLRRPMQILHGLGIAAFLAVLVGTNLL